MKVTIYHNPHCSNSRKALEIIRAHGIEPHIVEYLSEPRPAAGGENGPVDRFQRRTPLTPNELRHLIHDQLKMKVCDVMRSKEPVYDEMKLAGRDDDCLLA